MSFKKFIARALVYLPINRLRIFTYRRLLGYHIGERTVIKGTYLYCKKVIIGHQCTLLQGNMIRCNHFEMGDHSSILENNRISGPGNFKMGDNSRIINEHFIDLTNNVNFGKEAWLAGRESQLWTHGSLHTKNGKDLSITIEDNCYIGSGVKIAPGTYIAANNLIGLGSVLGGRFRESGTLITGNPAIVTKRDLDWRKNW